MEELLLLAADDSSDEDDVAAFLLAKRMQRKRKRPNGGVQFDLSELDNETSLQLYRFDVDELQRLLQGLRIPDKIVCRNGTTASGLEALCVCLRRLAYPARLSDLEFVFERSVSELSEIFNHMLLFISERFLCLLHRLDQQWIIDRVPEYIQAVVAKGAALDNCFGFIDGTVLRICKPGINEQEMFSGHKRYHGLKFQTVVLPDGMIGHMFGPTEGRHHDSYMLAASGLLNQLETSFNDQQGSAYCIYGDGAYPLRRHLMCGYRGGNLTAEQRVFNRSMNSLRTSVEWGYGEIVQHFAFVDFFKNQKIYLQPVELHYAVAVLLTNCRTCIKGSKASAYFNCRPPTLEEYLSNAP